MAINAKLPLEVVTEVGLVPNHLMPVQQTLDKVYSVPVVDSWKMERIKLKMLSNTDNNLGKIYNVMQSTRQLQNKGLTHWVASPQKEECPFKQSLKHDSWCCCFTGKSIIID